MFNLINFFTMLHDDGDIWTYCKRDSFFSKNDVFTTCRNGRPVRCILSREEDMIITGKRHPSMCQYKVRTSDHFLGGGVFFWKVLSLRRFMQVYVYILYWRCITVFIFDISRSGSGTTALLKRLMSGFMWMPGVPLMCPFWFVKP